MGKTKEEGETRHLRATEATHRRKQRGQSNRGTTHSGVRRDNEPTCSAGNRVWRRGDYSVEWSWKVVREAAWLQEVEGSFPQVPFAQVESTLRYIYELPERAVPSDTSAVCPSGKAEKQLIMLREYAIHNWPQPQEWQWFESVDRMWPQYTMIFV